MLLPGQAMVFLPILKYLFQTPMLSREATSVQLNRFQVILIVAFASIPLFVQLPFKINLFLAWEGAYRLSLGQVPFRDFSLPMGFGFWLVPALFFKVFGPYLVSLVKAQVFLNIVGALAFRSILGRLGLSPAKVLLALLVYCVSFMFVNFWPWYNNSVFIFELVGVYFLLVYVQKTSARAKVFALVACAFFSSLSFFTKQDGGALAVATVGLLLLYHALVSKNYKGVLFFATSFIFFSLAFYVPFLPYDITYWFNLGQPPHNARFNVNDLLKDIFEGSEWIKFYLLVAVVVFLSKFNRDRGVLRDQNEVMFALFTLCILGQAMLVQVTSYIPHNVNVYYHSFAIAYLLHLPFNFKLEKIANLLAITVLLLFWWSADYWRYSLRLIDRVYPGFSQADRSLDKVSKYTWFIPDSARTQKPLRWKASTYRSFQGVLLPEETIEGIERIMKLPEVQNKNIQVLNLSELTPLAYEIGYTPLTGHPLWFHKNVSLFDREIAQLNHNIRNRKYDLVLFEVIPNLNQFYPEEVRQALLKNYKKVDTFQAPRENPTNKVEVYVKPVNDVQ